MAPRSTDTPMIAVGLQPAASSSSLSLDMSGYELSTENLFGEKARVELDKIDMDDLCRLLQTTDDGLTTNEAQRRIEVFGANALDTKEQSAILHFLSFMWNPLSWVMEGAAIVAIGLSNGGGRAPDWPDFVGIVLLLLVNASLGFYEERGAANAVKVRQLIRCCSLLQALMSSLAPKASVKRDGQWIEVEARELVPGDVIAFKIGAIIPADCRLTEAKAVSIDQASLTGESLPVSRKIGDQCFSGSICKAGEAVGIVTATGRHTLFGRAASLVGQSEAPSHLQIVMTRIGSFCLLLIAVFVVLELIVLFGVKRWAYRRGIDAVLVLLVGGVPIAMPIVLSCTLAVGAQQLAKSGAICTRISAIEELAGVQILVSDKTGTLTTNKLSIDRPTVKTYAGTDIDQVILLTARASRTVNQDHIDHCVVGTLADPAMARAGIEELDVLPFDPSRKRTEITYRENGRIYRATKGMSPVIEQLCADKTYSAQLEADVDDFARRGLRALAVALEEVINGIPQGFKLIGLLSLHDPPREDTQQTIVDAQSLGVQVKMCTGDALAIAKETGRRLNLGDAMFNSDVFDKPELVRQHGYASLSAMILDCNGLAGVHPEHKHRTVQLLQSLGNLVAMTGDGANDAPALSKADVGIAVEGSTDAARSAADLVLTHEGLSAIITAIRQSRIVFQRMQSNSIYACAVTVRIVVGSAICAFAFEFDMPPFMILLIALLNDGTILTLSLDTVRPSSAPDVWDLRLIFGTAASLGLYLAATTILFLALILHTTLFESIGLEAFVEANDPRLHSLVYLQVAMGSQAVIFVTRAHSWSFVERPSLALIAAFCLAQIISSLLAAFASWGFTEIAPAPGLWIAAVWIYNIVTFLALDPIKFATRAVLKSIRGGVTARELQARRQAKLLLEGQKDAGDREGAYYSNRLGFLGRSRVKLAKSIGGKHVVLNTSEQRRFSMQSVQQSALQLQRSRSVTRAR